MDSSFGPWEPLTVEAAVELFGPADFRWRVSGGHALELHSGTSWRAHDATDICFSRSDAPTVRELLDGWDIHVAAAGTLSPWDGQPLKAKAHQNNLWARPSPDAPWALDITISDGDDDRWIYRRNRAVTRVWDQAVLKESTDQTPYLSPELQLLFKSVDMRPKDRVDACAVIPDLSSDQVRFLFDALPPVHVWLELVPRS